MATLESCGRASRPSTMLRRMAESKDVINLDKRCLYCGTSSSKLEADHILPRKAVGSSNCWKNLQTLCEPCNQRKTDQRIDYRNAERRREAEDRCGCGRQPPTDLENLAAATGTLHKARRHWYEALSAALSAEHSPQDVAAAAGMPPPAPPPMIPQEVDGQP